MQYSLSFPWILNLILYGGDLSLHVWQFFHWQKNWQISLCEVRRHLWYCINTVDLFTVASTYSAEQEHFITKRMQHYFGNSWKRCRDSQLKCVKHCLNCSSALEYSVWVISQREISPSEFLLTKFLPSGIFTLRNFRRVEFSPRRIFAS